MNKNSINKRGVVPLIGLFQIVFQFWWQILIIIGIILLFSFFQDYFNPEYCITDTFENRATIQAYGFGISDVQKNTNSICFRSNKQELVQQMITQINDKRLEKEFEIMKIKEENRNKIITTLLKPEYFYPLLITIIIIILGRYHIKHRI